MITVAEPSSGWTVVSPPNWCRDELRVLMELVPECPTPLTSGPSSELEESLGIELWRAVANVRQWAETPQQEQPTLFWRARARATDDYAAELSALAEPRRSEAEAVAPELGKALRCFAALTTSPATADAGALVLACREVVAWAENRGLAETAIQFAEAAATIMPRSAALANLAGKTCRTWGRRGRAELWYDRAIGLSRRIPGKVGVRQYVRAHLGFATTLLEIEEHRTALGHIRTAALAAKRTGMRGKAAEAFHDALSLTLLDGQLAQAAIFARKAIKTYPFHHQRYPALGHDFALLLISRGLYSTALSILQSAVRRLPAPGEQLVAWGTLARSAAGAARPTRFEEAVAKVDALAPRFTQTASAGLYSVGEGARLLGLWEMAERYALDALDAGMKTDNIQIVNRSRQLIDAVAARDPGLPELPKNDPSALLLRRLAPAVRLRLAKWRGPTWRPRRHLGPEDLDEY
jgi:tetratricopeptide (TPR) repeat protein